MSQCTFVPETRTRAESKAKARPRGIASSRSLSRPGEVVRCDDDEGVSVSCAL